MINKNRLIKLTQKLISIKSENPGGDEHQIALFLKGYFGRIGLKARIYEFKHRRSNLVVWLKGENTGRSLLISPHLDTVPAGKNWRFPAFGAVIRNNRIYGRGASDCKGNLAAGVESINSLIEDNVTLGYNLIFAATADEEAGSGWGLVPLLSKGILKPESAVILDASEFDIIVTQKGLIHLKIKVQGKKAHGAYPRQGENAIDQAIDAIKEMEKFRFRYQPSPLLKGPTLNLGTIHGGDKVNIVSDWCEFELDLRLLPGMPERYILNTVKDIVKKHAPKFKIEITAIQRPYEIDRGHPLVGCLVRAAKDFKIKARVAGSEGATVATLFQKKACVIRDSLSDFRTKTRRIRDIPAVAFGLASAGCAHVSDEYVNINNLFYGTKVLERFLKIYKF
jgi:acetylornithine deacetylase/succinyl-diaminopimelate desuccinylase family protein